MTKTITRLFDTHTQALDAVQDLESAGIDHKTISLVSNNADNWHDGRRTDGPLGDRNGDGENDVADGAGKGATTGGLLGGGAGLLAGLGMLAIPGLGPVVAAGWLASTAVGAIAGAVAGGAAGGIRTTRSRAIPAARKRCSVCSDSTTTRSPKSTRSSFASAFGTLHTVCTVGFRRSCDTSRATPDVLGLGAKK